MRNFLKDERQTHEPEPVDPLDLEQTVEQTDLDPELELIPGPRPHAIKIFSTIKSAISRAFGKRTDSTS